MKIKKITLNKFKRFTQLTIQDIPKTAKLVVLAGPNGCGKSSIFDALYSWHRHACTGFGGWDDSYHVKYSGAGSISWNQAVQVEFHDPLSTDPDEKRKTIYVRTAYRNDPEFRIGQLNKTQPALQENRLHRMIDNDATVGLNYARIASQGLEDIYEKEDPNTTIGQFREKTIGEIRDSIKRLFPDLILQGVGNPLTTGTFKFDKGDSKGFLYKNLSGGEKAAFDLIFDLIVKKREFNNTVFCVDEPDAHMNTRLQGELLQELYTLIPAGSQLWVATHSIWMMRRARDIYAVHPDEIVFLELDGINFDQEQVLAPVKPTRAFWQKILDVALDDLAELVAPRQVIICEGKPLGTGGKNVAIDAKCYEEIFSSEFPDTRFLSSGNASEVENDRLALIEAIKALVEGTRVIRLIDRDDHSPEDIQEKQGQGVKVLTRRHLESYLFDDEVLTALCVAQGKSEAVPNVISDKTTAIRNSVGRGNPTDDIKSASGEIYVAIKNRLGLVGCGNDAKTFMRSTLAPLISQDMEVYKELRHDIFE